MKYSSQIKSISYLKAHTAEIVRAMSESRESMIITQNGEAKRGPFPKELLELGIRDLQTLVQRRLLRGG